MWIDDDALIITPGTSVRVNEPRLYIEAGTIGAPTLAFNADTNLGIYRRGADSLGISCGGTNEVYTTAAGGLVATDDITAFSDSRLKTNVQVITNALDKIMMLDGITYEKIAEKYNGRKTGVLAQQVQEVLPEAVAEDKETGYLTVAYGNMVGLLIEAIKEQNQEIEDLKTYIFSLGLD